MSVCGQSVLGCSVIHISSSCLAAAPLHAAMPSDMQSCRMQLVSVPLIRNYNAHYLLLEVRPIYSKKKQFNGQEYLSDTRHRHLLGQWDSTWPHALHNPAVMGCDCNNTQGNGMGLDGDCM